MMHVTGMLGMGDNIYQRAVVRHMGPMQLVTPWPQFYSDLPDVECLPSLTMLRTQRRNMQRDRECWATPQVGLSPRVQIGYGPPGPTSQLHGIFESARINVPNKQFVFDLPTAQPWRLPRHDRPYVVVRPATVRREWVAAARNPDPHLLARAAQMCLDLGLDVISIADLDEVEERPVLPLPPASWQMLHGEANTTDLMTMVQNAKGVIGGVGWLLPMALAYRTPMLLIYGGWGKANGPQRVLDPRIDTSMLVQVMPENFCPCNDPHHACDKHVSNLNFQRGFNEFLGLFDPDAHLVA